MNINRRKQESCYFFFVSGLFLILPFPLVSLDVFAWFAMVPLLYACMKANRRDSFLGGYLFGITWHGGLLYWAYIYHFLALPLIVVIASLYPAFFCLGLNILMKKKNLTRILWVSPLLWTSLEYLKSLGFFGFPWNSLGYSQYRNLSIIQLSEVTGVFGISFLIVLINSCFLYCFMVRKEKNRSLKAGSLAVLLIAGVILWGNLRLKASLPGDLRKQGGQASNLESSASLTVALVQPNTGTEANWADDHSEILRCLKELSFRTADSNPDLIVWPETAVGENLELSFLYDSEIRKVIHELLRNTKSSLITGSPYRTHEEDYNSAFLISPEGRLVDRYDKIHLVPAGEYFPYMRGVSLIQRLLQDAGDFAPGERRTIFEIPDRGRFSSLICFEAIFGDLTRKFVRDGAQFLINITNDAWSKSLTSHYQHASIATFRAIENRVYFLRLGNSGITRVIDPYGRIEKSLPAYQTGFLIANISRVSGKTFYTLHGDLFAKTVLAFTILVCLFNLMSRHLHLRRK